MKKTVLTLVFVAALLLTSCQTKQSAIKDLRSLSQQIELSGNSYSLNDWEKAGRDYYKINQRLAKHAGEYNNQEMQEISELNGRCLRSFTDGAVHKVNGAVDMLKSLIEGFVK